MVAAPYFSQFPNLLPNQLLFWFLLIPITFACSISRTVQYVLYPVSLTQFELIFKGKPTWLRKTFSIVNYQQKKNFDWKNLTSYAPKYMEFKIHPHGHIQKTYDATCKTKQRPKGTAKETGWEGALRPGEDRALRSSFSFASSTPDEALGKLATQKYQLM